MKNVSVNYSHIEGKTYSLFGDSDSTTGYYTRIKSLADELIQNHDIHEIITETGRFSSRKRLLRSMLKKPAPGMTISMCLNRIHGELLAYTVKTEEHLKSLTIKRLWDRRLSTTREQYHLYMLEIELTNRLFRDIFTKADQKIALLPYCLQDFSVSSKAAKNDFDYQCKHCSGKCFENHASRLLKKHHVEPYIWRGSDIKHLARDAMRNDRQLAVFGIACIPELVWGMRKCREYGIPVLGLPLNANRCVRWFGEFFQNSVDLEELERLLL